MANSMPRWKGPEYENKYPATYETGIAKQGNTIMEPNTDQLKAPGPKPDAKDDLKSLPPAEVEEKLESSPDGLTKAEAQKRLTQYGPNEIEEKKTNPFLKFLTYFWGPIP